MIGSLWSPVSPKTDERLQPVEIYALAVKDSVLSLSLAFLVCLVTAWHHEVRLRSCRGRCSQSFPAYQEPKIDLNALPFRGQVWAGLPTAGGDDDMTGLSMAGGDDENTGLGLGWGGLPTAGGDDDITGLRSAGLVWLSLSLSLSLSLRLSLSLSLSLLVSLSLSSFVIGWAGLG